VPARWEVDLPDGIAARLELTVPEPATALVVDGQRVTAERRGRFLCLDGLTGGGHVIAIEHPQA